MWQMWQNLAAGLMLAWSSPSTVLVNTLEDLRNKLISCQVFRKENMWRDYTSKFETCELVNFKSFNYNHGVFWTAEAYVPQSRPPIRTIQLTSIQEMHSSGFSSFHTNWSICFIIILEKYWYQNTDLKWHSY